MYSTNEGVHSSFFHHSPRIKIFLTTHSIILCGVSIFYTKFRISRRKWNQIRKYFNPLVSGPDPGKKTRGQKSRCSVPLSILNGSHGLAVVSYGEMFPNVNLNRILNIFQEFSQSCLSQCLELKWFQFIQKFKKIPWIRQLQWF